MPQPAPLISIIVAMAHNRVIGKDNALPWHLPEDLKHFKQLTTSHAILMGRKTFQSIGKPLPNRLNIVLTRQPNYQPPGVQVVHAFDEALHTARQAGRQHLFIIGGQNVYRLALPLAHELYLTRVHADIPGDAFFPPFDDQQWQLLDQQHHDPDVRHAFAFTFEHYRRR
jgi:dihydrofolate reductase